MSLLQMSISGGILILVILVIRALLLHQLPKKAFAALWLVAVVRLVVPFSVPVFGQAFSGVEQVMWDGFSSTPIATLVEPGGIVSETRNVWKIIWISGIVCCAVYFLVAFLISARKFRDATPVDNGFTRQWQDGHKLFRHVSIRQSGQISAPLTYGLFRPVILFPTDTHWQDEQRLVYLFAHEYAHIRRLDILKKMLATAALCLHWFNPMAWVMYLLFNRDMELACDEEVLQQGQFETRKDYALLLIDLQERGSRAHWGSHFSKNAVEERIVVIMKSKKISPIYQAVAVVLVLAALLCFATSARAKTPLVTTAQAQETVWVWPTGSRTISTSFGERIHPLTGETMFFDHIYIAGKRGDAVYASLSGIVSQTGFDAKYGNFVVISSGDGVQTLYGQLESILVDEGGGVKAGAQLGTVGATGTVTGPCLSFGVLVDGEPVDPMGYFA